MKTPVNKNKLISLLAKLFAGIFIVICLAVGVVGLILPIIPGLLFLAIAAMIAARHSPSLDRWLRKNRVIGSYLDSGEGFLTLSWLQKNSILIMAVPENLYRHHRADLCPDREFVKLFQLSNIGRIVKSLASRHFNT